MKRIKAVIIIVVFTFFSRPFIHTQEIRNPALLSAIESYKKGEFQESEKIISRELSNNMFHGRDLIMAHFYLGLTNYELNKGFIARSYFEEVLRLDPEFTFTWSKINSDAAGLFNGLKETILSTINVRTVPEGAEIYFNHNKIGNSPLTEKRIAGGDYDIIAVKQGYKMLNTIVHAIPGDTVDVTIPLIEEKNNGSAIIETTPDNASIFIDGEFRGYSPLLLSPITPGTYEITLKKQGYYSREGTLDIEAGIIEKFNQELEKIKEPWLVTELIPGLGQYRLGYKKHSLVFTSLTAAYAAFYYFRVGRNNPYKDLPSLKISGGTVYVDPETGQISIEDARYLIGGSEVEEAVFWAEYTRQDNEKYLYDKKKMRMILVGGGLYLLHLLDTFILIKHDMKKKVSQVNDDVFSLQLKSDWQSCRLVLSYRF